MDLGSASYVLVRLFSRICGGHMVSLAFAVPLRLIEAIAVVLLVICFIGCVLILSPFLGALWVIAKVTEQ